MRETDSVVFFYGNKDHMSNFFYSPFTSDNLSFRCGEQYIMYRKALQFNDTNTLEQILEAQKPQQMKRLGRLVRNFDDNVWKSVREEVAYDAVFLKYSQNPDLKALLLATGEKYIAEASPSDRIWGIGLGEGDPRINHRSQWRGRNILGIALMKVREALQDVANE